MFIWTISGLTLAACSDIEDFLGLDDGGGASGPVRFMPADEAARMAQEIALAPPENIDIMNWQLQVTATSTRMLEDGTESPIVSYGFVLDGDTTNPTQTHPDGFTIDNDGLITLTSGTFDFEAQNSFTLIVQATDTPINADDEARTGRQTYTITVGNEDEGDSVYEIVGDVVAGETLEVMRISEDPDGEGAISVVWYRGTASTPTGTRGTTYLVTADDVGETIGAVISYIDGANEPESIDITASSVAFASGMGSRPIGVDEGTIATTTTLATVSATSELGEAVTYAIGTAGDHDNNLFTVNSSGEISLLSAGTWDYESDTREYVVEVIASASDGEGGMDTARARITFNVQNLQEGPADYEITDDNGVLSVALVEANSEDPDGRVGGVSYQWFKIENNGDRTNVGTDSATYTPLPADENLIHGVYIGYTDGAGTVYTPMDDGDATTIEVLASPIKLAGAPYTGSINEDGTSATLPQIMASVDNAPRISVIIYNFVGDDGGFSIDGGTGEVIAFGLSLDYETTPRYELTVRVTYDEDNDTNTPNETRDVQVVIDVVNVEEGDATYEIMQSTPALAEDTILTAQIVGVGTADAMDDPDGVESGSIRYQWFADGVEIDDETSARYTIGSDVATAYDVRVSYLDGYNAGLDPADQVRTMVEASTSPIKLMQDGSPTLSYTGSIDEDASAGTEVVTISAIVDSPAQDSTIRYHFVSSNTIQASDQGFTIDTTNGQIISFSVALDYETTPRYELTVRVAYDADGVIATRDDLITREVQVVIDVGNVIDQSEDIILMQDGAVVSSYTASIDEAAGSRFRAEVTSIIASVDTPAQDSRIRYHFVLSDDTTNTEDEEFVIGTSDGIIRVAGNLDYETTPRYTLTVRVTYDADGDIGTTTDQITRDVEVVINVTDVAEQGASPAIIPDRQAFAHQDPYEPDELGLTPMPDADPSAG